MVFPAKYSGLVIDDKVNKLITDVCLEIGKRYEIHFVEIGTDKDHVYFLIESIPMITVRRIVTIIKSIMSRQVLEKMPELKKELWGSSLRTSGYYTVTVGKRGNETVIAKYVNEQGREIEYVQIVQKGSKITSIIPDVPRFKDVYEGVGDYFSFSDLNEHEQGTLLILSELQNKPENRHKLQHLTGIEDVMLSRCVKIGKSGHYI